MIDPVIHPVVLCGGGGTRLWPRSRTAKPKPFLPLIGNSSLFQETVARVSPGFGFAAPVIVTGSRHADHVRAQLDADCEASVIVEPCARNTAAAIALAAHRLDQDAVMLVCPSDHHIADADAFRLAVRGAAALASEGFLVSLGIEASRAETGFGYLERGEPLTHGGFRVVQFVEKPGRTKAESYVASGKYFWNGGIFAFRVGTFLQELETHAPSIAQAARASVLGGQQSGDVFLPDASRFRGFEPLSVDYAIMEKTDRAALVPVAMGWSDIGSWDALHAALPSDACGNSVRGSAELVDCRGVLVDSDGPRVSAIGLDDVIIVVDGNEVLVTTREGAQRVGKLTGAADQ